MIEVFNNGKWTIEVYENSSEIQVTDGWRVYYGFPDLANNVIRYDSCNFPKYIQKKALQLCKKYKINFY